MLNQLIKFSQNESNNNLSHLFYSNAHIVLFLLSFRHLNYVSSGTTTSQNLCNHTSGARLILLRIEHCQSMITFNLLIEHFSTLQKRLYQQNRMINRISRYQNPNEQCVLLLKIDK